MAEPIYNPFSDEDEILVKDKEGKIIVVKPASEKQERKKDATAPEERVKLPEKIRDSSFIDTENIAKEVLKESQVTLSDPVLLKRLLAIFVTYLKGIRDIIETREILLRQAKIGGVELSPDVAEKVLKKLVEKSKGLPTLTQKIIEDIPFVASDEKILKRQGPFGSFPEYTIRRAKTFVPPAAEKKESPPPPLAPKEEPAKPPEPKEKKDILKMIQDIPEYTIVKKAEAPQRGTPTPPKISQKVEPVVIKEKQKMELVGPIDELRELDITEFRRLDPNPKTVCQKIREKLRVLEKESFQDMASGISAWRQSPIVKLYIAMGQESIIMRIPIEKVIEKRKSESKPFLTLEEFDAIMDLNEKIRF